MSIVKASVCCDRPDQIMDMAYVLERELSEWFTFLPSGSCWINVDPRHVSKATGLAQVLRYYGMSREDVLAFGDSMNDYAMLRYVGHPIVMENARYAVKQVAQHVIGTNRDHAVQRALRQLLDALPWGTPAGPHPGESARRPGARRRPAGAGRRPGPGEGTLPRARHLPATCPVVESSPQPCIRLPKGAVGQVTAQQQAHCRGGAVW